MGIRTKAQHGTSLLQVVEAVLDDHGQYAAERHGNVLDRIAELESELADLRQLRRRIDAAVTAA